VGPEVAALSWRSSCSDQWFEEIDAISCNVCDSMRRSMQWMSSSSVVEFVEDGRRVPKDASKDSSEGNALENRM
jgi:hypothetical protein